MKNSGERIKRCIAPTLVGLLFLFIGIALIIYEVHTFMKMEKVPGVIREITSGTDSEGKEQHYAYVDYEYNGKKYNFKRLPSYSFTMRKGKSIKLFISPYEPKQPHSLQEIRVGGVLIFVVAGASVIWINVSPFVKVGLRNLRKKRLVMHGICILAKIDSVELADFSINGESPYRVYCSYEDPFSVTIYKFKSGDLWYVPKAYYHKDMEIKVYVEGMDYSHYYMEIEEA